MQISSSQARETSAPAKPLTAPTPVATPAPAPAPTESVNLGSAPAPMPTASPLPAAPTPPQAPPLPQPTKPWTVLIWSCSDNNLYDPMMDNLNQAEHVGSGPNLNIVAETSQQPKGGDVQRLYLTKSDAPGVNSPVVQDLGKDVDMADHRSLADFIKWGEKNFPAQHYMLVVADHGGGWQGACESESHGTWMDLPDMATGLKLAQDATGKKLDVIGFDACLMGSAEVADQLAPFADYIVGSEETEAGPGWDYDPSQSDLGGDKAPQADPTSANPAPPAARMDGTINWTGILNHVNKSTHRTHSLFESANASTVETLSPRALATDIVKMARSHQDDLGTMTAIDSTKVPEVVQAVNDLGKAILGDSATPDQWATVIHQTQKFDQFYDLADFAQHADSAFGAKDEKLKAAAAEVEKAVKDASIAEQHSSSYPNAHGLNIELDDHPDKKAPPHLSQAPLKDGETGSYSDTALAHDTVWAQALHKMHGTPVDLPTT